MHSRGRCAGGQRSRGGACPLRAGPAGTGEGSGTPARGIPRPATHLDELLLGGFHGLAAVPDCAVAPDTGPPVVEVLPLAVGHREVRFEVRDADLPVGLSPDQHEGELPVGRRLHEAIGRDGGPADDDVGVEGLARRAADRRLGEPDGLRLGRGARRTVCDAHGGFLDGLALPLGGDGRPDGGLLGGRRRDWVPFLALPGIPRVVHGERAKNPRKERFWPQRGTAGPENPLSRPCPRAASGMFRRGISSPPRVPSASRFRPNPVSFKGLLFVLYG